MPTTLSPITDLNQDEAQIVARLIRLKSPNTSAVAQLVADGCFSIHRGATGAYVFGNDGFSVDVRSQSQVANLVTKLEEVGIAVHSFGVCRDDWTWVCETTSKDDHLLRHAVWDCWRQACDVFKETVK